MSTITSTNTINPNSEMDFAQKLLDINQKADEKKRENLEQIKSEFLSLAKNLKVQLYEYESKLEVWGRQLAMISPIYVFRILFNISTQHNIIISSLSKLRTMLTDENNNTAIKEIKNIEKEYILTLIKRFGTNFDMIKNNQQIARRDTEMAHKNTKFDIQKIKRNVNELYRNLNV